MVHRTQAVGAMPSVFGPGFRKCVGYGGLEGCGGDVDAEICAFIPRLGSWRWLQSNTEQNGGFLSSAQSRHPTKHRTAATTLGMRLGSTPRTPKNNSSKLRVRGSYVLAFFHWDSERIVVWVLFRAEEPRG